MPKQSDQLIYSKHNLQVLDTIHISLPHSILQERQHQLTELSKSVQFLSDVRFLINIYLKLIITGIQGEWKLNESFEERDMKVLE